jgi:hypothetical protein
MCGRFPHIHKPYGMSASSSGVKKNTKPKTSILRDGPADTVVYSKLIMKGLWKFINVISIKCH